MYWSPSIQAQQFWTIFILFLLIKMNWYTTTWGSKARIIHRNYSSLPGLSRRALPRGSHSRLPRKLYFPPFSEVPFQIPFEVSSDWTKREKLAICQVHCLVDKYVISKCVCIWCDPISSCQHHKLEISMEIASIILAKWQHAKLHDCVQQTKQLSTGYILLNCNLVFVHYINVAKR